MTGETLRKKLWADLRIEETTEQCNEYLVKFFETYPGVKTYIDQTKKFVQRFYFTYTFTGRRRRFDAGAYDSYQLARMCRQAVNARIQSTSSDLVMYNLIDISRWIKGLGGRILLTVHDSIVFQLPKNVDGVLANLTHLITEKTAERAPWLPVEWKFDVGKGPNYGDTHLEVA